MTFLYPLALFGLAAVPITLFIYYFHKLNKPVIVSTVFLWPQQQIKAGTGRQFSQLIKNRLLLLEILLILLLTIAALGLGLRNSKQIYQAVIILDSSASMQAVDQEGRTPIVKAKQDIVRFLRDKEPFSVSLLESGFQPRLLNSDLRDINKLPRILDQWQAYKTYHSLNPALKMAGQILPKHGMITVYTDTEPEQARLKQLQNQKRIQWRAYGRAADNIAITQAGRRRNKDQEELFLILKNFTKAKQQVLVNLYQKKNITKQWTLTLEPEAKPRQLLYNLSRTDDIMEFRLTNKDSLAIDNSVQLVPDDEKKIPLKLIISDRKLEQKILEMMAVFNNQVQLLPTAKINPFKQPAMIISDNPVTKEHIPAKLRESLWIIEFNQESDQTFYGPYILDKNHPFTRELVLKGVRWPGLKGTKQGYPLVAAIKQSLIIEKETNSNRRKHFLIYLNLFKSNLHKTVNWPILWSNILKAKKETLSGLASKNIHTGANSIARFFESPKLKLISSTGQTSEITGHGSRFPIRVNKKGLYTLVLNDKTYAQLSFLFLSAQESDLRHKTSGVWGDVDTASYNKLYIVDITWFFLLLALMIIMIHHFMIYQWYFNFENTCSCHKSFGKS